MQASDGATRQHGWEAWYQRDSESLQNFIDRRCRARQCVAYGPDIIQDTFIIGFQKISAKQYEDRGKSLRAYLYGIARNLINDVTRLQMRERSDTEYIDSLAGAALDMDGKLDLDNILTWVKAAYGRQPRLQRRVVDGRYLSSKSAEELAEELGESTNNIRVIAHRAIKQIREELVIHHNLGLSTDTIRDCLRIL
jgi:RNA polymerase sigma factor (sigma-70 family)